MESIVTKHRSNQEVESVIFGFGVWIGLVVWKTLSAKLGCDLLAQCVHIAMSLVLYPSPLYGVLEVDGFALAKLRHLHLEISDGMNVTSVWQTTLDFW